MALRPTSYVPHRWAIYSLLWIVSVAELVVTAFRIHHTRALTGTHEAIVAELLVTAILTIIWVPLTLLFHRSANAADTSGRGTGSSLSPRHGETGGNLLLWIMWLVGAAFATHRWPTRGFAALSGERDIVISLVALAWVAFSLLTIAKIFGLMEYAAIRAANAGSYGNSTGGAFRDKPVNGAGSAPVRGAGLGATV